MDDTPRRSLRRQLLFLLILMLMLGAVLFYSSTYAARFERYVSSFSITYLYEMLDQMQRPFQDKIAGNFSIISGIDTYLASVFPDRTVDFSQRRGFFDYQKNGLGVDQLLFLSESAAYVTPEGDTGILSIGDELITLFCEQQPVTAHCLWHFDQDMFLFACPVTPYTVDGVSYGAIATLYTPDKIQSLLRLSAFENKAAIYITDRSGNVAFVDDHTLAEGVGTVFNLPRRLLGDGALSAEEAARIREDFAAGRQGSAETMHGQESRYLVYQPVENSAYMMACELPKATAENVMAGYQKTLARSLLRLFGVLGGLALLALLALYKVQADRLRSHAQLNAEIAANHAKSEFLSSMSHDIRTPMNAIIGMANVAVSHIGDDARVLDCLQKILLSGRHLHTLINDVLDITAIESGRLHFSPAPVSLTAVADNLRQLMMQDALARSQRLSVSLSNLRQDWVTVDPLRLNQILINLVSNAIKYTPEGGAIDVTLAQRAGREPGSILTLLTVTDTGIGMSESFLSTLYDRFARADDKRVTYTEGTGLGLAITKRVVDAMGGRIEVSSQLDVGSTFTVTLPLPAASRPAEPEAIPAPQAMPGTGVRLLIAEDNELNWEIACELLGEYGFACERAEDGEICLHMVENAPSGYYDAVLMDMQMPVMDGLEAARAIRALPGEAARIPILAMTANAFSEDVERCLAAGMQEHLAKPIEVESVVAALRRCISRLNAA